MRNRTTELTAAARDELPPGAWMPAAEFELVVKRTPLVSIDLIIRSPEGRILLGRRTNPPAQGTLFVPGGRICKNETRADAFPRITLAELGARFELADARFLGVYEHLYPDNALQRSGFGTHYVVLAYELRLAPSRLSPPRGQHDHYCWMSAGEILQSAKVHQNTKAYFAQTPAAVE